MTSPEPSESPPAGGTSGRWVAVGVLVAIGLAFAAASWAWRTYTADPGDDELVGWSDAGPPPSPVKGQ